MEENERTTLGEMEIESEEPITGLDGMVNEELFRYACNVSQGIMAENSSGLIFDSNEAASEFERWAVWVHEDADPRFVASFFLHVGIAIALSLVGQLATDEPPDEPECEDECSFSISK